MNTNPENIAESVNRESAALTMSVTLIKKKKYIYTLCKQEETPSYTRTGAILRTAESPSVVVPLQPNLVRDVTYAN